MPTERKCERCNAPIPDSAHGLRRYCGPECHRLFRAKLFKARRNGVRVKATRKAEAAPTPAPPPSEPRRGLCTEDWGLTPDEVEFGAACDREQRRKGRQLRRSEVLAVAVSLGYRKVGSEGGANG